MVYQIYIMRKIHFFPQTNQVDTLFFMEKTDVHYITASSYGLGFFMEQWNEFKIKKKYFFVWSPLQIGIQKCCI